MCRCCLQDQVRRRADVRLQVSDRGRQDPVFVQLEKVSQVPQLRAHNSDPFSVLVKIELIHIFIQENHHS